MFSCNTSRPRRTLTHVGFVLKACIVLQCCSALGADLSSKLTSVIRVNSPEVAYADDLADAYSSFDVQRAVDGSLICSANGDRLSLSEDAIVDIREGLRFYGELVKKHPNEAWAHDLYGLCLFESGKPEDALMQFSRSIELRPGWHIPWCHRGILYLSRGFAKEAASDFDESLRLKQSRFGYYSRSALRYYVCDTDGAIEDLSRALELHLSIRCLRRRASFYMMKGRHDLAVADASKIIAQLPEDDDAFELRARARLLKGEYQSAISDYDVALRIRLSADRYFDRATALICINQFREAEADCTECIRVYGLDEKAVYLRSVALLSQKLYDRALLDAQFCIKNTPENSKARVVLASVYLHSPVLRDVKKAIEELTVACELTGWREGDTILDLASAHATDNNFLGAIEISRTALLLPDTSAEFKSRASELIVKWSEATK